jgi:hypothetical protein
MKKSWVVTWAVLVFTSFAMAEVTIIRSGQATEPDGKKSEIIIQAGARTIVPATVDSKETKTDSGTHTETVTRLRDPNGNYVEWLRASDVVRETAPGQIERTTEVVERTWQGGERERRLIQQSATKTDSGETSTTTESRRDSSGRMVLAREISASSAQKTDGSIASVRTEKDFDVNGRPVVTREITGVTRTSVDGKTQTTVSTIQSVDHLRGGIGESYREEVTVRTDAHSVRSEAVTQRPVSGGWENDSRAVTVETRSADGTVQRETVVEGRSLYSGGATSSALMPQTKSVEHQVRQADGTIVIQRDDYRRDVNGDWRPVTFSTEAARVGY